MIRRLIVELHTYKIKLHWVKVRGHSNQQGNDNADKAATWGQNGGTNMEDMTECIEWLEASTTDTQQEMQEQNTEQNGNCDTKILK